MLQSVLDTIPQNICWKDRKSVFLGCNMNYARMVGLDSPQHIIGKTDWDLPWKKEETEHFIAYDQRIMSADISEYHIIEPALNASGEQRWLDTSKVTLHNSDGQVSGILVAFEDITERKLAQEQLFEMTRKAEAANKSKSEFLANMSHEIRTPLNGVMGMLQLLETTDQTEEQKEYIRTAIRSSKRLTSLLSDILDLSRIEAGKMPLQEVKFDLVCLKEAVMDLFGMEAKNKGLTLTFDLDEHLLGVFLGDEVRVRQILLNLVGNALKFTQQGGVTIEVVALSRLSDELQHVLFIVHDTGPGITDDQLSSIFEPFVQGEVSYVRRHQGAGLGLSIVIRLVRLMGGEISIESERGCGTSMYVSIPFRLPSRLLTPSALTPDHCTPLESRTLRILLAEDDSVTRLSIQKLLEKAGHHVSVATDGVQALKALEKNVFDLILMDIQMPEMDGVEATRTIRFKDRFESVRDIPIIALTAYAMVGDKEKFIGAGMNDYISKPVDIATLTKTIDRVMSKMTTAK
jgi:PAS domain S-box-containing protein